MNKDQGSKISKNEKKISTMFWKNIQDPKKKCVKLMVVHSSDPGDKEGSSLVHLSR
jgi:hypothetical protein